MTIARDEAKAARAEITFMLTDVEGSTRMWERDAIAMRAALSRHDALIQEAVTRHNGELLRSRGEGDSSFSVFGDAISAAAAAVDIQLGLAAEPWPAGLSLKVRIALHVGEAELREGDYYGSDVNRCARLRSLAVGGQTLMSAAAQARTAQHMPEGAYLIDLGSHRLKDLTEPERIYQISHPDLPSDFPELRGLEAVPNNLPVKLTSFIGRDREVADLTDILRGSRLVTLTGTGGCGKTRLALEVAAGLSDAFPDGVWFVELSSTTEPALVSSVVAAALGIGERPAPPGSAAAADPGAAVRDAVVAHLAGRRTLLLLDNCEHLLSAVAETSSKLLEAVRGLTVLATSRELLGVPGEVSWRVPSLAAPNPAHLPRLEEFGAFPAVRLFIDRARLHDREFTVTAANQAAVAQVCASLSGIPLALELAAARVRVLSVQQIADRLDDQFRLLTSAVRPGLSRQATLRATVDWSHNLLDAAEAAVFRRLAVFSGGWSLEAAEAVCGRGPAEDILDLLGRLVDKSLVVRDAGGGHSRFRLLEPIRQYALQKLEESGDLEAVRREHLRWFTGLARESAERLKGAGQEATLEQLDAEVENIRAALELAISRRLPEGLEVAGSLRLYWLYRSMLSEGRSWIEAALAASPGASPDLRADALMGAGRLAQQMYDIPAAEGFHRAALQLAESENLAVRAAQATRYLAMTAHFAGRLQEATEAFADAIARARASTDPYLLAVALLDAAHCAVESGRDPTDLVTEGIAIANSLGDDRDVGFGLLVRGRAELARGDTALAGTTLTQSADVLRRVDDRLNLAVALIELGRVGVLDGAASNAAAHLADGIKLAQQIDEPREIAAGLTVAAVLAADAGEPTTSAHLLGATGGRQPPAGLVEPAAVAMRAGLLARLTEVFQPAELDLELHAGARLGLESAVDKALQLLSPY
ncbi:MAG: AAA family ATPase [Candidatus Dormibacteria bacterium]